MKKKKNENISKIKFSHKNSIKSENNPRVKYNYDNGNNIIGNILEVNKIKSNSIKTNPDFQDKFDISKFNEETKKNLILSEYIQRSDFSFIKIKKAKEKYEPKNIKSFYNFENCKIVINIIIDDDSLNSSQNLLKILRFILSQENINKNNILICIFFQHFSHETSFKYLFPGLKLYNYIESLPYSNSKFYCSFGNFTQEKKLNILLFYKEASTFVEVNKFFYTHIISDLINFHPDKKNSILIFNWPNGKFFSEKKDKTGVGGKPNQNIFKKFINICKNENMILIPDINFIPNEKEKDFGFVHQYCLENDKTKINLYWYMICGYPIDHRFYVINMNNELLYHLNNFYKRQISIYANENYHDYSLVIYLKKYMKNIEIQKIIDIKVEYTGLPLNLKNYFHDLILRRGSEFVNGFNLLKYFFSCEICDHKRFFKKIFLFFILLNNFIQFFWLGITFLISYAVFNDTFGSEGNKMDYFCSLGYVIMTIILFSTSLLYIENKPKIKSNKFQRNSQLKTDGYYLILVLYLIHYLYFFFFIICAIIAVVHIKQGKYSDIYDSGFYILGINFFIIILCINIFLFMLPTFFKISNFFSKKFFYYLFLHLPNMYGFFHYPYLFTCIKTVNSKKRKIESLYIICYVLLNGIVTVLCLVFDTTRQRRMNFFCVMAIIISALSVVKIFISIISICLIKNFGKKFINENDEINYINEENTSINDNANDESNINKKSNESNTNYKLQTEVKGFGLSENSENNKDTIENNNNTFNNTFKYPLDTIENNKDTNQNETEIKQSVISISNSKNIFLNNDSKNQEIFPEDNNNNSQSFSVQNSSENPENDNISK